MIKANSMVVSQRQMPIKSSVSAENPTLGDYGFIFADVCAVETQLKDKMFEDEGDP